MESALQINLRGDRLGTMSNGPSDTVETIKYLNRRPNVYLVRALWGGIGHAGSGRTKQREGAAGWIICCDFV